MNYKHYVHNYLLNPRHEVTVIVIGAGGTGSQVITSLGRMNYALKELGHMGLQVKIYDADIVTSANCGRQLFAPQEVGINKAIVLATKLNMFFGTSWEAVSENFSEETEGANIVISCVDTVQSRLAIKENLLSDKFHYVSDMNRTFYWMDFGNMFDRGQVVIGTPHPIEQPKGRGDCVDSLRMITDVFDLSEADDKDSGPSCSLAEALSRQDLFINSTLANIGMAVLWKFFTKGVLDYQGAFLNLNSMKVNPIKIEKS